MANIPLQSILFPGLSDKYTTPTVDATLTQAGAAADAKKTGDEISGLKNDLNQLESVYSAFVVETATGSIASFTDGADDVPVKDLTVAIEPAQSGSGDPSPENVRPISGWTGANVTVNDDVFSIDFPTEAGTVYGGTLDVTTGVLTVDTARIALSSLFFDVINTHYFYSAVTGIAYNTFQIWSDTYKTTGPYNGYNESNFDNCTIAISQSQPRIAIRDDSYSDVASFVASLTDKYIVYGLAEPQTYQLAPQEVQTILGQNNIFADTGNVTVQYRADTKLYIDKVLSQP